MSLHVVVMANKHSRWLKRLLHQLAGQTVPPDVITVLANIPVDSEHVPGICGEMRVSLNTTHDVGAVRRYQDAYEAYDMLPSALNGVYTDFVMVLRDSDKLTFNCLEMLLDQFKESRQTVIGACNYLRESENIVYPGKRQAVAPVNFTFANCMLSVPRLKKCLPRWEPDGIGEGNDYDLISKMLWGRQLLVCPELLVYSDPVYWRLREREEIQDEINHRKGRPRKL